MVYLYSKSNRVSHKKAGGNKMTEHKRNYKGIKYTVPQSVIDDLKNLHGVDAFKEIEDMLEREIKSKEEK